MSIVSVDNIQPIGSGTSVTINSAATLVLNNVNSTGVVTATSFVGSGANLTSLPSQVTISNNADNRIITGGSGTNLNGETNLRFNGSSFSIGGHDPQKRFHVREDSNSQHHIAYLQNRYSGNNTSSLIAMSCGGVDFSDNKYAHMGAVISGVNENGTNLIFGTNEHNGSVQTRLTIRPDGKIGISEGNPSNQLHVSGTTGTSAGGLLRLDATDGDNFILFDNTNNNSEWAVGYDSTSRNRFDLWYDSDGSSYDLKFSVDGATGAVRKPKNPVFIAYRTSYYSLTTSDTEMVYTNERIDVGGNYDPSNGRFTAPVDGLYEFAYATIAHNSNTVYRFQLKVNGALPYNPMKLELRLHQASSEYGTNGEYVCYVNMTAGQYASVFARADSNVSCYGDSNFGYTYFRGRLIG